jgi:hypothetical protein
MYKYNYNILSNIGCGMAQKGAAWLRGCGMAQ